MGYLPREKVPKYLKFGPKRFDLAMYTNLVQDTNTCKTGGFFYSVEDDWLKLVIKTGYYEEDDIDYLKAYDAYIYSDKYSMYEVKIKSKNYISIQKVEPGKLYRDKILLIDSKNDAKLFEEMFVDPELVVSYFDKETTHCHVKWEDVRSQFGGFETWITEKDFPYADHWAWWWQIRSGVIWNCRLIDKLKVLEFKTPKIQKVGSFKDPRSFWITSASEVIDFTKFINSKGLEFYGDKSEIEDKNLYIGYINFYDDAKILEVNSTPRLTSKIKKEYSGFYNFEKRRGMLWDISSIKSVITEILK